MSRKDIFFLAAWIIFPPIILFSVHGNFLLSSILYLVLPAIYFSWRRPGIILKALLVALATMPPMAIFDYMAFYNKAWTVPTIFSFRFFQLIPFEDFFFTFWSVYMIITAFDYFFPKISSERINKSRFIKRAVGIMVVFIIFLGFYFMKPNWLIIPYYDFFLLIVAFIIPATVLFIKRPAYRKYLYSIALYELVLFLPYEIAAGHLGFWTFPSNQYLGMIYLAGWAFPIEEFLEWMILFSAATLSFGNFMTG